jgi:hypothetical protein
MTNLDQWKAGATVETFAALFHGGRHGGIIYNCDMCPAGALCAQSTGVGCKDVFAQWAKMEAA